MKNKRSALSLERLFFPFCGLYFDKYIIYANTAIILIVFILGMQNKDQRHHTQCHNENDRLTMETNNWQCEQPIENEPRIFPREVVCLNARAPLVAKWRAYSDRLNRGFKYNSYNFVFPILNCFEKILFAKMHLDRNISEIFFVK